MDIKPFYNPPKIKDIFDINPNGCKFEVSTPIELFRTIHYGGELEFTKMIIDSLHEEDIFYDIGASVGLVAIHAGLCSRKVFAFEPDPYYRSRLTRNIEINGLKNIEVVPWAVSNQLGSSNWYTSGKGGKSPCMKNIGHENVIVAEIKTIDYAINRGLMPHPDVIKMDIEGAESIALEGMSHLLLSNNAPQKIFLEIHPHLLTLFNSTEDDVFGKLSTSGYQPVFIRQRGEQLHVAFYKTSTPNVERARSTLLHKGPPFSRKLTKQDEDIFLTCWKNALNIPINRSRLSQLESGIIREETAIKGRLAGDIQDAILRILLGDSIDTESFNFLEIGTLFGINAICIYKLVNPKFSLKHLTLVDPLTGYYQAGKLDALTQTPVDKKTLEYNLTTAGIPASDYTIIEGFSNESLTVKRVQEKNYNIIFIDGDHSYQGVKNDFYTYSNLLAKNGFLVIDNFRDGTSPGVDRFVDELLKSNTNFELVGISWRTVVLQRK